MKSPTLSNTRNKLLLLSIALAALGLSSCLSLPADPSQFESATLLGVVFDGTSRGVQGFTIILDESQAVSSDINGKFTFPAVSKGPHRLSATKPGHEPVRLDFNFALRSQIVYITSLSNRDYLANAELAMRQGNFARAREQVAKAQALLPDDPVARYLSAMVQVGVREYDSAFHSLVGLLDAGYREPAVYLLMIDIAQLDSRFAAGLREQLDKDPYVAKIPQISRALQKLEPAATKE